MTFDISVCIMYVKVFTSNRIRVRGLCTDIEEDSKGQGDTGEDTAGVVDEGHNVAKSRVWWSLACSLSWSRDPGTGTT